MLRRGIVAVLALSLVAADDTAQTDGAAPATPWVNGKNEEITVWGDLFARWDQTRWLISTEIETPFPLTFQKEKNFEFFTDGFQVRTVISCEKTWKLNNRHYEVNCAIEDVGLQANLADRYTDRMEALAQSVLDELDAKLTGAKLQLQVGDDGRVIETDLEGVTETTDRDREIHETLRQVLSRVTVGFDMKMQKFNQLHEGKWMEYHSALMSMPVPNSGDAPRASSTLIHYLNDYQGHILVQSIGRGMIEVPALSGGQDPNANAFGSAGSASSLPSAQSAGLSAISGSNGGNGATPGEESDQATQWTLPSITYETNLIGVSIYDRDEGFMTERVWALEGKPTASAGLNNRGYWHAGRITMLGKDDHPSVGPTRIVSPRGQHIAGMPAWDPVDSGVN
jgi:hypothetical protein